VRRLAITNLLFLAAVALAGCGSSGRYVHPSADLGAVKVVAVLPFDNLVSDKLAAERVQKIFFTVLLESGAFEVMEPGHVLQTVRRSQLDPSAMTVDDIKKLGQSLKVQALFLGSVIEYDDGRSGMGVNAPRVKLHLRMVDTETATTLWSATPSQSGMSVSGRLLGIGGDPASQVADDLIRVEIAKLVK
jgi:curli biogenesis system outer membrane secretion channel CsgG